MFRKKIFKAAVFSIVFFEIFYLGYWNFKNHPYQYVFFNPIFKNYSKNNFDLDYLLTSKETEWAKEKKAFGMYAFNLEDKMSGFFIKGELVGTGEIINIQDFELFTYIAIITEYEGKSLIVKYFISTSDENVIDFACWWYDEESDSIMGEVSKEIKVRFIDED